MKILFFCDLAGSFGNATRISKIYQYLISLGKDVVLCNLHDFHDSWAKLCLNPSFVASVVGNSQTGDWAHIKSEAFVSLGKSVISKAIKTHRPDVVFAEETRTAYMALQDREEVPVIADLHGIISEEYAENPNHRVSERHLARLREIEAEVCQKAQNILAVSDEMKAYLKSRYEAPSHKIAVVQNGANMYSACASHASRAKLVFGGIFNYWEDVDTYLDMAARDSSYEYYLAGRGPLKEHILERIRSERLGIRYLGSMNRQEVLDLFSNMTIGVAPSTQNMTRHVASPVKVYDYMSCGLPTITVNCGAWARDVGENRCGLVSEDNSADGLLACAAKLQDKHTWEDLSANCRKAVRTKFNWNKVMEPIASLVEKY